MRRREEHSKALTITRTRNGFLVSDLGNDLDGFRGARTTDAVVANDYAHLLEILKELLGPIDYFPDYTVTKTTFQADEFEPYATKTF